MKKHEVEGILRLITFTNVDEDTNEEVVEGIKVKILKEMYNGEPLNCTCNSEEYIMEIEDQLSSFKEGLYRYSYVLEEYTSSTACGMEYDTRLTNLILGKLSNREEAIIRAFEVM